MPILNHREGDPLTRDVGTRLPKENASVVCSIRARHVVGMLGARKTDGILLKASRILNDAIERPEPTQVSELQDKALASRRLLKPGRPGSECSTIIAAHRSTPVSLCNTD